MPRPRAFAGFSSFGGFGSFGSFGSLGSLGSSFGSFGSLGNLGSLQTRAIMICFFSARYRFPPPPSNLSRNEKELKEFCRI